MEAKQQQYKVKDQIDEGKDEYAEYNEPDSATSGKNYQIK